MYADVWQRTVTVVEQEKPPQKPLLYRPDGTALVPPQPSIGFRPQKDNREK